MYAIINTYKTYNLDYHVISYKGGIIMTEQLIKDIKNIQKRLINKEMTGEAYEEKMQIVKSEALRQAIMLLTADLED